MPEFPDDVTCTMGTFTNAQGLKLASYCCHLKDVEKIRGIVYLCHGYAAHTQFQWFRAPEPGEVHTVFDNTVMEGLVRAGWSVHALDHQGHGRSEGAGGLPGYFEAFDHLVAEADTYVHDVVLKDPQWKHFGHNVHLFGISMGGATAIEMSLLHPKTYRGCVLYSPMLSLEKVREEVVAVCITNRHLEYFARPIAFLAPTLPIAKPAENKIHPASQTEMNIDPLTYSGNVRARVALEFVEVTIKLMHHRLQEMSVPFVTFHSVSDTFTDPDGSARLLEVATARDKTYMKVGEGCDVDANMFHGLGTEPGWDKVLARALEWLADRSVQAAAPCKGNEMDSPVQNISVSVAASTVL